MIEKNLLTMFQGWQQSSILMPRGSICYPGPPHSYRPVLKAMPFVDAFSILLFENLSFADISNHS